MNTTDMLRRVAIAAAIAIVLPATGRADFTPVPIQHHCTGDGLAQFECGNPQAIPGCEVTCVGRATCTDAQCDTYYVEGPLGPTDEIVAQFYLAPVCACVGGWKTIDSVTHVACLAELFRRPDLHRSKTAKALSKCELGVLSGRVTLPVGGTCAASDPRTAASIASYREQAEQSIMRKCPTEVLTQLYGTDGPESMATFVNGLLANAEEAAAAGIGLAVRPAVVAP